jgi:hypothetical protein
MPKSVNQSKQDRQRTTAAFARGGNTPMHRQQADGPAQSGRSGKVQTPAPGAKAAKGGPKVHVGGRSVPAAPGSTGPR